MSDTKLYIPESFRDLEVLLEAEKSEQARWPRESIAPWRQWVGDPRAEGEEGGDGGDGGGTVTTTDTGGGAGGAEPVTMDKMFQAFEGFRGDVVKRFDGLEQRIPAAEFEDDLDAEDDEDDDKTPVNRSPEFFDPRRFSDEDFDEHGQITREAQTRELQAMMQRTVAEALAPDRQAAADRDRTARADALEQKHPIFADAEKRQPILREAKQAASRMAQAAGNPALRDMWRDPDFLESTYFGMIGRKALDGETPAGEGGGQEITLERGGSAGPAGGSGDGGKSIAKSIVDLAGKSKYRLGS